MENNWEEYIRQNRKLFDTEEPSAGLWGRIESRIEKRPTGTTANMRILRWAAAAAALVLALSLAWILTAKKTPAPNETAANIDTAVPTGTAQLRDTFTGLRDTDGFENRTVRDPENADGNTGDSRLPRNALAVNNDSIMENYTSDIRSKYKELVLLTRDEPDLHKKFTYDFDFLDSTFLVLRAASHNSPDNEKVIKAMIQNLKLQSELLQKQLYIIQSYKKQGNEKSVKNTL